MFSKLRRHLRRPAAGRGQRGFTLVEVVVMTSIATVGVLATLVVANATLRTSDNNEKRVAATNLAREGIELVRGARDSNWQAYDRQLQAIPAVTEPALQDWDCYASDSGQAAAVTLPNRKPACGGQFSVDSAAVGTAVNYVAYPNTGNGVPWFQKQASGASSTKNNTYLICKNANGFYAPTAVAAGGNPCGSNGQAFYRRVTVQRGKDLGSGQFNLLVKSYVTWPDRPDIASNPNDGDLYIEEYLTDWRKFQ